MDPAQVLVLIGMAFVALGGAGLWWSRSPAPAPRAPVRPRSRPIPELPDSAWVRPDAGES